MSFGVEPNTISCYYILNRASTFIGLGSAGNNIRQILPAFGGTISGESFSLSEIEAQFPDFEQLPNTIITGHEKLPTTSFIVGIPQKNGNNISRVEILRLMKEYNINRLRSIVPFVKLRGNDVTFVNVVEDCIHPEIRKQEVLNNKGTRLSKEQLTNFYDILIRQQNRVCMSKLIFDIRIFNR